MWINEFHYDNVSSDTSEFIEIACNADVNMAGYQLVLYNGNNGESYMTETLSGSCSLSTDSFLIVDLAGIQNGSPDGIALVDPSGAVIEFISYEGSFTAVGGWADGMTSVDVGVVESGSTPVGHSLQLIGDGCNRIDFSWQAPTADSKGRINDNQTISCVSENMNSALCCCYSSMEIIHIYNTENSILVRALPLVNHFTGIRFSICI